MLLFSCDERSNYNIFGATATTKERQKIAINKLMRNNDIRRTSEEEKDFVRRNSRWQSAAKRLVYFNFHLAPQRLSLPQPALALAKYLKYNYGLNTHDDPGTAALRPFVARGGDTHAGSQSPSSFLH